MTTKRGKVVGYKVGVYGGGTGNTREHPASNGCVFATKSEARRAGAELLSRWMQPSDFRVIETTEEEINYRFPRRSSRPERIEKRAPAPQPTPSRITEAQYSRACNNHEGWCRTCLDFTRGCTEPDAEDYNCESCESPHSVVGAEQALLLGLIEF
jgi:hypothetical protein